VDSGGGIWGKEEGGKNEGDDEILIRIGFGWVINAKNWGSVLVVMAFAF
jgi:hypothetical protein